MGQVQVMNGGQGLVIVPYPRCMNAVPVPQIGRAPGLVQGGPGIDGVAEGPGKDSGIFRIPLGCVPVGPTSCILKVLGQIPVVEGHHRLDALLTEHVEDPAVMVQPGLIHPTSGAGEDPGPSNGETVGTHPHLLHQGDVFGVAMILVTGLIPVRPVKDSPRFPAEGVPDGIRPALLPGGPLHLEGGSGRPPGKIRRECKPICLAHAHTSSLTVPALFIVLVPGSGGPIGFNHGIDATSSSAQHRPRGPLSHRAGLRVSNFDSFRPEKRPVVLSRQGYAPKPADMEDTLLEYESVLHFEDFD